MHRGIPCVCLCSSSSGGSSCCISSLQREDERLSQCHWSGSPLPHIVYSKAFGSAASDSHKHLAFTFSSPLHKQAGFFWGKDNIPRQLHPFIHPSIRLVRQKFSRCSSELPYKGRRGKKKNAEEDASEKRRHRELLNDSRQRS